MWTMEAVRFLFPLRSCEGDIVPDPNGRGCFYHEIGRCCGPCVGSTPQDEYSKLCAELIQLLHTGEAPQIEQLRARMMRMAEEWRFEEAAKLREQLRGIEIVTARLQRLERMRSQINAAIVQSALPNADGQIGATVFLVRGGLVRRHLVIHDWNDERRLKKALRETFDTKETSAAFTGKTELDEMMILDRWLRANDDDSCCIWLNEEDRVARQWTSNTFRRLKLWAQQNL
jgi:excinuclease ABC subunit C